MTSPTPEAPRDAIEVYLDALLPLLPGSPAEVRSTLDEVSSHLHDEAERRVVSGATPEQAAEGAVAAFGTPREFVTSLRVGGGGPDVTLVMALVRDAVFLVGVGAVAVGLSGLLAEFLGRWRGAVFVAGDMPGVTYTTDRCAQFLALDTGTNDCSTAAALDHWGEIVMSRVAVGVLGVVMLVLWFSVLRRRGPRPITAALVPAVAVALFGVATVFLGGQALVQLLGGWNAGIGQWVSAAGVSAIACVVFVPALLRSLRAPVV